MARAAVDLVPLAVERQRNPLHVAVGIIQVLRLAVGPLGSEDARMAAAFVQGLNRDKASVRLRLVLTEGSEDSARKIDAGQADLAMLRADIAMPSTSLVCR